jgi:glycosyltransferase involved in cell wall biosynthesis
VNDASTNATTGATTGATQGAAAVRSYAVVMPVYNERELLSKALRRLLETTPARGTDGAALERRVIIIDDGSTDGTREVVDQLRLHPPEPGVQAVLHARNMGKGAAVRSGFAAALGGLGSASPADIVLIHDADLEYDPADHQRVLAPIVDGRADAVLGSRFLGETHRVLYFWHSVANRGLTLLSNALTNLNLTDIECCSKAFTRRVAEKIRIEEDRFGVEPELVAKLAKMRLAEGGMTRHVRVYEVGVTYAGRTYDEGKKITWRDGFAALACIVKYGARR